MEKGEGKKKNKSSKSLIRVERRQADAKAEKWNTGEEEVRKK